MEMVTQHIKCGDKVTPLNKLPKGSTAESRLCEVSKHTRMHKYLDERGKCIDN